MIAEELVGLINRVEYKTHISYLPDSQGMDIKSFDNSSLQDMYYLDTLNCVTKSKRYNRKCLFDTFGSICDLTGDEMKERVIKEIETYRTWFKDAGTCALGMRGIMFDAWLTKLKRPQTWPNELCLYALCILTRRHTLVFTAGQPWCTMEKKSGVTLLIAQEMCEVILLYLGNKLYGT